VSAEGRIELVEQPGESHLLYVRVGQDLILTARASGDTHHARGEAVILDLPVHRCHLFDRSGLAVKGCRGR
jgi:multiple sugar transport system ATP-binding protein